MDTMTATKIVGGVCGSFLIFLLVKWGAESIYAPGGHGETEAAYVIEVEEPAAVEMAEAGDAAAEGDGEVAAAEPTFAELYAAADIASGEKVFKKCKACHKLEDGANATGPFLYGIVDRGVAAVEFGFSDAMAAHGGTWTPEALNEFLARPKDYIPGTKMTFTGLKSESDRADVIAYLATIGG